MVHVGVYQVPHTQGFSDMGIRINYTLHLLPPGQAGEKGSSASLRSIVSRVIVLVIRDRARFTNTSHEHE
jgi:hypothetical protein